MADKDFDACVADDRPPRFLIIPLFSRIKHQFDSFDCFQGLGMWYTESVINIGLKHMAVSTLCPSTRFDGNGVPWLINVSVRLIATGPISERFLLFGYLHCVMGWGCGIRNQ